MRRKPGQLLDLEAQILSVAVDALFDGDPPDKALARLEDAGHLSSRWEDHELAEAAGRPRRRLYRVTSAGQAALTVHVWSSQPPVADRTAAFGRSIEPA